MELALPTKETLSRDAQSWASRASQVAITDRASCEQAGLLLRSVKGLRIEIQRWFAPHLERAQETKRQAEAARKGLVDECERMEAPLVAAERTIKSALLKWEQEQEVLRQAEERRLQAEAQALAETQTLAAAASLEREATTAGDAGMLQEANDLLEQPIEAPAVLVKSMVPKVDGVSYRDRWVAHPTVNVKALAGAVAAGLAPESFLTPNMPALNAWARATKGGQTIPGVRVVNDRQVAARG